MRTTLKRGIGRVAVVNGDGQAVLPPGALSPVTRYRQPERKRGALRRVGTILFVLVALALAAVLGLAAGPTCGSSRAWPRRRRSAGSRSLPKSLSVPRPDRPNVALVIGYDHRPEDGTASSARTRSCSCAPIRRTTRSRCSRSHATSSSEIHCPDGPNGDRAHQRRLLLLRSAGVARDRPPTSPASRSTS